MNVNSNVYVFIMMIFITEMFTFATFYILYTRMVFGGILSDNLGLQSPNPNKCTLIIPKKKKSKMKKKEEEVG